MDGFTLKTARINTNGFHIHRCWNLKGWKLLADRIATSDKAIAWPIDQLGIFYSISSFSCCIIR